MTPNSPEVERLRANLEEIRSLIGSSQTQSVTNNNGGAPVWAVAVMIASLACVVCMYIKTDAQEQMRQRDMQDMAQLRGRVLSLEQHKDALLRRVNDLEARRDGS